MGRRVDRLVMMAIIRISLVKIDFVGVRGCGRSNLDAGRNRIATSPPVPRARHFDPDRKSMERTPLFCLDTKDLYQDQYQVVFRLGLYEFALDRDLDTFRLNHHPYRFRPCEDHRLPTLSRLSDLDHLVDGDVFDSHPKSCTV